MQLRIYLITISLFFVSCAQEFPSKYIYFIDSNKKICERYTLDTKKIRAKFDQKIDYANCPIILGFELEESGKVMQWARDSKKKLEECN